MDRRQTIALGAAAAAAASFGAAARASIPDGGQALVTGCSSGFGLLTAVTLARSGIAVTATMRAPDTNNRRAAQALRDLASGEDLPIVIDGLDVTDTGSVADAVARAEARAPVEVLVNNAGIGLLGPVELQSPEFVARLFDTNVTGYQRLVRAALPGMRKRGRGYTILVSSGLGRFLHPALSMYTATKHATEAMGEMLAYEVAPFGIDTTIVQPGRFPTDFADNALELLKETLAKADPEQRDAYARHLDIARDWATEPVDTDAETVAKVMLDLVAMAPGTRPLRRRATPGDRKGLTDRINDAVWDLQGPYLRGGPYADWVRKVRG